MAPTAERERRPTNVDTRVLDELAYEKVCVGVVLCDLMRFEQDLDVSLHRALELYGASEEEREELLSRSFERACARYHQET